MLGGSNRKRGEKMAERKLYNIIIAHHLEGIIGAYGIYRLLTTLRDKCREIGFDHFKEIAGDIDTILIKQGVTSDLEE